MSGRARLAALAGLLGAVLCVIGAFVDPRRAAAAYLVAYAAGLSAALGALSLVMIGRLSNATWLVAPRRLFERVAWTVPLFALLAVPLLVAIPVLYPWTWPAERLAPAVASAVSRKTAYLNVPFFVARAVLYLATWVVLGEAMRRASLRQDAGPDAAATRRLYRLSAGGLPALAVTLTFAAFDWLMSLSPEWYSTIYGATWWAGGVVGALALVGILARGARRGAMADVLTTAHLHAIGKLLLTFVMLWAYFAFSQLLVIWIARIPVEARWYAVRARGGWAVVSGVLLVGHFALPFLALLPRWTKRHAGALAALCWWLLAMHWLDTYWLVMPEITPAGPAPHWLDLAALLAVGGLAAAFGAWRMRGAATVPRGDPRLGESLEYDVA
jgi:hypothetical protein